MTKLNPFILVVVDNQLNPDKYTLKQLEDNREAAWAAYRDAACAAWATCAATYRDTWAATYRATCAATYRDTWAATYRDATIATTYWLDSYFFITGENKQDYINELENKND